VPRELSASRGLSAKATRGARCWPPGWPEEHLREVYAVTHPDAADRLLEAVILECATSEVPELNRLARTLRKWRTEIINRHRNGDSNGPTERIGSGFPQFAN